MRPDETLLGRRVVLLGAGGVLLAGCGSSGGDAKRSASPTGSASASASRSGPIVQQQSTGTVITSDDLGEVVSQLNAAVRAGDADAMKAIVPELELGKWRNRLRSLVKFPLEDLGFVFEDTRNRKVNSSGGPLDVDANVVLTHRIKNCDARIVVQGYTAELSKAGPKAPVLVHTLRGPNDDDAPWDLKGVWQVFESDHVVIAARDEHADQARQYLSAIDRGAADAMAIVAPATGITRMSITIDEPSSKVFGGGAPDRNGFATSMDYIDPEVAAAQGVDSTGGQGSKGKRIFATSRIVLRPGALSSESYAHSVALHESIHGLALKWAPSTAPWIAEGLAQWAESGFAAGLRRDGFQTGLIRSSFPGFAQRFLGFDGSYDYGLFQRQDDRTVSSNYACSAAVYSMVEEARGRAAVLKLAADLYAHDVNDGPRRAGWGTQKALFDAAGRWAAAL